MTDWKKIIAEISPTIGMALGGPIGGMAAKVVCDVFGLNKEASGDEINTALYNATPEQLLALKKADNDFKIQIEQLNINLESIAEKDRESARQRQAAMHDWTPNVIATLIITGWLIMQWYLVMHAIPADNRELIMRMLGILDGALMLVLSFFFGSSAGSRNKDDTIANMSKM